MPPGPPPSRTRPGAPPPTWRERLNALRHIPAFLRLVWRTHRGYASAIILLRFVRSGVPVATLWIGKLIIDTVVAAARTALTPAATERLWRLVALEIGIVIVADVLSRLSLYFESALADLFTTRLNLRLMEHAATLDLAQFEDPTFQDRLERATGRASTGISVFAGLLQIAQSVVTFGSLIAALVVFDPRLPLLLIAAIVPTFYGELRYAGIGYSVFHRRTAERRQLDYLRSIAASGQTAKEVQLFGLSSWLIDKFRALSERFYAENRRLARERSIVGGLLATLGTSAYYGAYVLVLARAVSGALSLGTLTFLTGAFTRGRDLLQQILSTTNNMAEQALYLDDLFAFFELRPTIISRSDGIAVPQPIREGFVFEDVGFRYPGSDRWAVRHLDLTLHARERIALVGENGAGKTTITKLLARLYDPTEGRIVLDGVDLRDYDLASLRATIGVIFQDFVRYDMRFDENVGVGRVSIMDELPTERPAEASSDDVPAAIVAAAERSLATTLLPRLTAGYGQMLGRRFANGVDLSGGEWQKVALARAYLRDSQVLVLDEPTAALDARAEYEVFVRFTDLVAGRMAVLISHRFSTVRMADRIVVLGGGRMVESGSHDVLVAQGGLYAELFEMQAEGYR